MTTVVEEWGAVDGWRRVVVPRSVAAHVGEHRVVLVATVVGELGGVGRRGSGRRDARRLEPRLWRAPQSQL